MNPIHPSSFPSALIIPKRSFQTKFPLKGGSRRGTLLGARKQVSYAFFGHSKPTPSLYPMVTNGSTFRAGSVSDASEEGERMNLFHPSSFILHPFSLEVHHGTNIGPCPRSRAAEGRPDGNAGSERN